MPRTSNAAVRIPTIAAAAVFLSAFLLFLIEPIATKEVLPTLGGAPQVWNTAMVFFQLCLLGGYLCAHWILKLSPRLQLAAYAVLLAGGLMFLPFSMHIPVGIAPITHPFEWMLMSLLVSLSAPFLLLSATNTLVQGWIAQKWPQAKINLYALYAASNAGSLLALLAFFPLEYKFPLADMEALWTAGFLVFAVLMAFTALRIPASTPPPRKEEFTPVPNPPSFEQCLWWALLAFLPSALFLSVTTFITTDIASVPLLWVAPLAIYLVTFILAFSAGWTPVKLAMQAEPVMLLVTAVLIVLSGMGGFPWYALLIPLLSLFVIALSCHGQLAKTKPFPRYLSRFYLWISVGGVAGGLFSSLLAPQLFSGPAEYPLLLLLACVMRPKIITAAQEKETKRRLFHLAILLIASALALKGLQYELAKPQWAAFTDEWLKSHMLRMTEINFDHRMVAALAAVIWFAAVAGALYRFKPDFLACMAVLLLVPTLYYTDNTTLYQKRNFFGVSTVYYDPVRDANVFRHGTTIHSVQNRDEKSRLMLAGYYQPVSGVYKMLRRQVQAKPLAIVGLGAGTLVCMNRNASADVFEIDPHVIDIARDLSLFTYLRDCGGKAHIILGDARINLSEQPEKRYGFMVLDAFSSDAIPVHLLTREAVAMYMSKLAPDGILAFHISNRFFDLSPLIGAIAQSLSLQAYRYFNTDLKTPNELPSLWVCLSRSTSRAQKQQFITLGWTPLNETGRSVWTDQYSNVLSYLY